MSVIAPFVQKLQRMRGRAEHEGEPEGKPRDERVAGTDDVSLIAELIRMRFYAHLSRAESA
jgi:hypothetical protein